MSSTTTNPRSPHRVVIIGSGFTGLACAIYLAREHGIKTIAFPAISCGVYRYPLEQAVAIAVRETATFIAAEDSIEKIIFACFGAESLDAYQRELARL